MCTTSSFCTLLLLSLPQACNDTVHLPLMHASLICMAACDQQVGSWQAPTPGAASCHLLHIAPDKACILDRTNPMEHNLYSC